MGRAFDQCHRGPGRAARGGHLGPDEPGSDHHQARLGAGRLEAGLDAEAVVERAQGEDTGHPLGAGQLAGRRTGGHDEAVVVQVGPVAE